MCIRDRSVLCAQRSEGGGRTLWTDLGNPRGGVSGEGAGLWASEAGAVRRCRDWKAGTAPIHHLAVLLRRRALHRAGARLQGHHRSHGGARPRHRPVPDESGCCGHDDVAQARLFLCADPDCRTQVLICRDCDRGHRYCADCAPDARRRSLHQAGRRYQASRRGRINHAERSRRYRARRCGTPQNKVTHHGSPPDRTNALLAADPAWVVDQRLPLDSRPSAHRPGWRCMGCGR